MNGRLYEMIAASVLWSTSPIMYVSGCFTGTITTLETQVVVSVDCGAQHTVAVTDTGQMFSWGSNQHGQLGRGYTDEPYTRTPK